MLNLTTLPAIHFPLISILFLLIFAASRYLVSATTITISTCPGSILITSRGWRTFSLTPM